MASIDTIRRIRVQQISEGADTVKRDLQGLVDAQGKVATATEATAVVTETASRRQLSAAAAYQKVLQQFDGSARAASAYERALSTLNRASGQGVVSAEEQFRVLGLIEGRYGAVARAAEQAAAAQKRSWSELGSVGSKVLENLEASRKLGSLGTAPPPAANSNGRLQGYQLQNLGYQANDVITSLASGISPMQTLAQQGGQIAQVFGGSGGATVGGAFEQAKEAAAGLAARIGIVGGAIAELATIAVTGVAAFSSYRSAQQELEKSLVGIGRASGTTAGQINALAPTVAATGNVSVRSAREMAGEFAATGRIGTEMYAGLIGTVKDYAATSGQELPDATKALAAAFADPAEGADTLNAQLGFLNGTTRENIQRLAAQGDRLGAQKTLLDAYRTGLTSATELTSGWGRATAAVGTIISDTWDKAGKAIDRVVTGGDLETRLATAQKVLENSRGRAGGIFGTILPSLAGSDVTAARDEVARLQADVDRRRTQSEEAQRAQRSLTIGGIVRSTLPDVEQLQKLQYKAEQVRKALADPVKFGMDRGAMADTQTAFENLSRAARTMADDISRFGSTAVAALNRTADFNARTVGYTPTARSAAEIQNRYAEQERTADSREMAGLRRARDLELSTARQQSAIGETATGGAFSRLSATIQGQVQSAAEQFGRVPAAIIAAIVEKESSGKAAPAIPRASVRTAGRHPPTASDRSPPAPSAISSRTEFPASTAWTRDSRCKASAPTSTF